MPKSTKNLHVPLPEPLYAALRSAAQRAGRPATEIARAAIDRWLTEERRAAVRAAIAEYAAAHAGTRDDLDPLLERAGIEQLLAATNPREKRKRKKRAR